MKKKHHYKYLMPKLNSRMLKMFLGGIWYYYVKESEKSMRVDMKRTKVVTTEENKKKQ